MAFKEEMYNDFVNNFSIVLKEKTKNLEISKLIFLCIGTDKVAGDSFGPLVGYKLKDLFKNEKKIEIIGSLDDIICRHNILNVMKDIKNMYDEPFLIAIDAAISNKIEIGKVIVSRNKINVGSGFNNKNIYVGDMSIKGIVSKNLNNPKYNFELLQKTSINLIMNMADWVVQGIFNAINV